MMPLTLLQIRWGSIWPLLRTLSCALTGLELASRQNKAARKMILFIVFTD